MKNPDVSLYEAPLKVDPAAVVINSEGFAWREVFIRLPNGLIADSLKETETLWKDLQKSGKALKKFDKLLLVAWDEAWCAEALVEHADASIVVLAKPRITQLGNRVDNLLNDGTYAVRWDGRGYIIIRLRDGAQVDPQIYPNPVLAERALLSQYPKRA